MPFLNLLTMSKIILAVKKFRFYDLVEGIRLCIQYAMYAIKQRIDMRTTSQIRVDLLNVHLIDRR